MLNGEDSGAEFECLYLAKAALYIFLNVGHFILTDAWNKALSRGAQTVL